MTPDQWLAAGLTCLVFGSLILGVCFVASLFGRWRDLRDDERLRSAWRAARECPDCPPVWLAGPFDQMRDEDVA